MKSTSEGHFLGLADFEIHHLFGTKTKNLAVDGQLKS